MIQNLTLNRLISVIIPCYNYGHYLAEAIESVRSQSYKFIETIVVDDGSVDNTKEVAGKYPDVIYVYQENQGLSAARNKGIDNSTGEFLVFLDADDWLLPDALSINLTYLLENKEAGLVTGTYINHVEENNKEVLKLPKGNSCSYETLLRRNHIAMHAAVMYPRWIFTHFRFDTSLKSCEDWDMYLQIARKFKIIQHLQPIAVYRRYGNSMSANFERMLTSGLEVLNRQVKFIKTTAEQQNLKYGRNRIKKLYTSKIYALIKNTGHTRKDMQPVSKLLWKYNKKLFIKYVLKNYFRFR